MISREYCLHAFAIIFVLVSSSNADVHMTNVFDRVQNSGPLDYKPAIAGSYLYGGPSVNSAYGGNMNTMKTYGVYAPNSKLSYDVSKSGSFCPNEPLDISSSESLLCCVNKPYVVDRDKKNDIGCCGDQLFLKSEAICCGQTITYKNEAADFENIGCCADMPYNRSEVVCCNNKMEKIKDELLSDAPFIACCGLPRIKYEDDAKSYADGFLLTVQYSIKSHICCEGKLSDLSSGNHKEYACCHESPFNVKTQMCCGFNIRERESRVQPKCCRASVFDATNEICCNGNVCSLGENEKHFKCCGFKKYDPKSQVCCGTKIFDVTDGENNDSKKCCGSSLYDTDSESCCSGLILNEPASGRKCCGLKLYDPYWFRCCNENYILPRSSYCNY